MKIITVHSFRRGAGKSTLAANLAVLFALHKQRVGVVDTDFQSPGIGQFLGLSEAEVTHTLNGYLWGQCEIQAAAYDVSARLGLAEPARLVVLPASSDTQDILKMVRSTCDLDRLNDGLQKLSEAYQLDYLLLDSMAGINEDTLVSIALANILLVLLHADQQDYQGTAVTVEVARNLGVTRILLALNEAPQWFDEASAAEQLKNTYQCEVAGIFPHSDDLLALVSARTMALYQPDHPILRVYKGIIDQITSA